MNKILDLLVNSNKTEVSDDCIDILNSGEGIIIQETGPLNRENVLKIYTKRSKINEAEGVGIEGYISLLENLSKSKFDEVMIYLIKHPQQEFFVFTDLKKTYLLGVLKLRKKQDQQSE